MLVSDFISESGGYIPQNEREAHDPRFEMAITCDVKPGEVARQAEKFGFDIQHNSPPLLRSNGSITESAQTQSPQFKNWFGNSKVVDADGNPRVVYHGTNEKFRVINMKKGAQGLFWFSSSKEKIARGESGGSSSSIIMPLYVRIQNPAGWDEYEKYGLGELRSLGYDGVILPDSEGFDGFVFSANQVKSAEKNKGNYDPTKNNIHEGSLFEALIDNKAGIGYEPRVHPHIGVSGLPVLMKPSVFLSLVAPIVKWEKPERQQSMTQSVKAGKPIAALMIRFAVPKEWLSDDLHRGATVSGHDGRHRMKAILETEGDVFTEVILRVSVGNDDAIPVSKILPNWLRRINKSCVTQSSAMKGSRTETKGPFFKMGKNPLRESPDFGYTDFNDREQDLSKVTFDLRNNGNETVAVFNGVDIGGIGIENVSSSHRIGQIYYSEVSKDWYGTGLGQILYDKAVQMAKNKGYRYLNSDSNRSSKAEKALKRLASRYPVTSIENKDGYLIKYQIDLSKIRATVQESPDFGYSQYNDREAELKEIPINVHNVYRGYVVVAEQPGKEYGYVKMEKSNNTYFKDPDRFPQTRVIRVARSDIDPRWRGTGLGQLLYDKAIQEAKRRGYKFFRSDVLRSKDGDSAWRKLSKRYPVEIIQSDSEHALIKDYTAYQIDLSKVQKAA